VIEDWARQILAYYDLILAACVVGIFFLQDRRIVQLEKRVAELERTLAP